MIGALGTDVCPADPNSGLWVGQVTLNYVNEVTVALDEDNIPRAKDPNLTTPTSDQAHLRLILHVNGSGQVNLLKDVAVASRDPLRAGTFSTGSEVIDYREEADALNPVSFLDSDNDLVLLTDERLYDQVPNQPAIRIASAVFDFGDSHASLAVNRIIQLAAEAAAARVADPDGDGNRLNDPDFSDLNMRLAVQGAAASDALLDAQVIVDSADVAADFFTFLQELDRTEVSEMAMGNAVSPQAQALADSLAATFYEDARGQALIAAIEDIAGNDVDFPDDLSKTTEAQNVASTYADTADQYHRFLAGQVFSDMIQGAAAAAAQAAVAAEATQASIEEAVELEADVRAARQGVIDTKITMYDDTRGDNAVNTVLQAVVATATAALSDPPPLSESDIRETSEAAGRLALAEGVQKFAVPATPTLDYTEFIRSDEFQDSAMEAADAAAIGAVSERRNNSLFTLFSLESAAKVETAKALTFVLSAAARAVRSELPMVGRFGIEVGDPRLTADIGPEELPLSGDVDALTGEIFLPADHPTNPFRHRRHPDHTVGFDIRREIRLDFDLASDQPGSRAGFGVDRITGIYREEIHGLHKPLGQDPVQNPIGLKVEGRFQLNRISLIENLNAL